MPNISNDYDSKKTDLINAAMRLFLIHGYDNTSVNMIINTLKVSKGAFYHYFNSKEELLDAIVDKKSGEVVVNVEPIVSDLSLDAVTKINRMFQSIIRVKVDMRGIPSSLFKQWVRDDYHRIRSKIEENTIKVVVPYLDKVILEGRERGLFSIANITGVSALIVILANNLNEILLKLLVNHDMQPDRQEVLDYVKLYTDAIEKVLGCKKGSIDIYDTVYLSGMIED